MAWRGVGLSSRRANAAGFTLIELLVVVAIVAVLAALAYPSYTAYLKRGQRAAAKAELLRMQVLVERQRLTSLGATPTQPANWTTSSAVAAHYQLAFQVAGTQDYTLTARALTGDAQSSDQQGETNCATLTMRVTGLDTRYEPAACWQ